MITIVLTSPLGHDEAEAADPESAVLAARTMWDEVAADNPLQGVQRRMTLYFVVDGQTVRTLTTRP